MKKGAVAVLAARGVKAPEGVALFESENPRRDFALIAAKFYGRQPQTIVAVTGTNGKTSTAHFAQQTPTGLEADPSNWRAGEKLFRGGDAERGIPACIACHGPQGRGNAPAAWPALRAQHAVYTYNQLKAFASGGRKSVGNDIMQVIASRLTEDEMRALASYTQGLR